MSGEKILIVDDELEICELIESYLSREGFDCSYVTEGKSAIQKVKSENPVLIILDYNLPGIEGPELCLEIRKITNAPVVFVSCRSDEIDKIVSLSAGADDYITKPFMPGELIARIKANLRRARMQTETKEDAENEIKAGNLVINPQMRSVTLNGEPVALTAKEFDILLTLAEKPKRIFSVDQLFNIAWREKAINGDSKTVGVHISYIRKKIEKDGNEYIINIRGVGYKFNHELIE